MKVNYVGQKLNRTFKIQLEEASYKQWVGSVEFELPGIQNEGGKPNTIETAVWT